MVTLFDDQVLFIWGQVIPLLIGNQMTWTCVTDFILTETADWLTISTRIGVDQVIPCSDKLVRSQSLH